MKYEEQFIITEYNKGRTTVSIAKELGTYNTTIRRILLRNKIRLRTTSEVNRIVKINPFSIEKSAYWLGWLATDGCITNKSNIILDLHKNDEYILTEYIKHIGYNVSITTQTSKKYGATQRRVAFSNKDSFNYLSSIGLTPRKTKTLKLNFPITWDFFRGVLEGDGYVRVSKTGCVSFQIATASLDFANQLGNFLKNEEIKYTINNSPSRKQLYLVSVFTQEDVFKCYNKLYSEGCIKLERKYKKFGLVVQKWNDINSAKTGKVPSANPVLASDRVLQYDEVAGQV